MERTWRLLSHNRIVQGRPNQNVELQVSRRAQGVAGPYNLIIEDQVKGTFPRFRSVDLDDQLGKHRLHGVDQSFRSGLVCSSGCTVLEVQRPCQFTLSRAKNPVRNICFRCFGSGLCGLCLLRRFFCSSTGTFLCWHCFLLHTPTNHKFSHE